MRKKKDKKKKDKNLKKSLAIFNKAQGEFESPPLTMKTLCLNLLDY